MTGAHARLTFANVVGESAALKEAVRRARLASSSNSTVLLQGETGTGKEIFAQSIHTSSARADGPFVAINCAAIPRELINTELFGYEGGAFTGADRQGRPGKFEQAHGGTLFLDEIGDMPLDLQTSLLRAIETHTLDAGADKPFPALTPLIGTLQEANPALGLRGARIHLVHEELLSQQLRALLRAGAETKVQLHIMFPMIATLEEVRRLRAVYQRVRQELQDEGVMLLPDTQIGIMIETPAAALMSDVLAREVDFFSIGANDLYQYTMAADRTNSRVTSMFGIVEPAVWRLIERIVRAGATHGKAVALCGELAADPKIGALLAGLGVQELSMSPPAIMRVKAALHEHSMDYWRQLAQKLLQAETAADMRAVLESVKTATISPKNLLS